MSKYHIHQAAQIVRAQSLQKPSVQEVYNRIRRKHGSNVQYISHDEMEALTHEFNVNSYTSTRKRHRRGQQNGADMGGDHPESGGEVQ